MDLAASQAIEIIVYKLRYHDQKSVENLSSWSDENEKQVQICSFDNRLNTSNHASKYWRNSISVVLRQN